MAHLRVTKDFKELMRDRDENKFAKDEECYELIQDDETDIRDFTVKLRGPENTPYQGGLFKLHFSIPNDYPFKPPNVCFVNKMYHPNIDSCGGICLDVLAKRWPPSYSYAKLLVSISALLEGPNPDDPLNGTVASEYKHDFPSFAKNAIEFTKKYADKDDRKKYAEVSVLIDSHNKTKK